jgi:hypothetical protein
MQRLHFTTVVYSPSLLIPRNWNWLYKAWLFCSASLTSPFWSIQTNPTCKKVLFSSRIVLSYFIEWGLMRLLSLLFQLFLYNLNFEFSLTTLWNCSCDTKSFASLTSPWYLTHFGFYEIILLIFHLTLILNILCRLIYL